MEFLHNAQVYSSHLHCPPLKLSAPLCFPHPSKPRVYQIPFQRPSRKATWFGCTLHQNFVSHKFFWPNNFSDQNFFCHICTYHEYLSSAQPNFYQTFWAKFFRPKIFLDQNFFVLNQECFKEDSRKL